MSKTIQEDVSKLPRWARRRIEILEANETFNLSQIKKLSSPDATRIEWQMVLDRHGIPDNATIIFKVGKDEIAIRLLDAFIQVHVGSTTSQGLLVKPISNNTIAISIEAKV